MNEPQTEVVVIGAGIVGAASTYYLAKAGVPVTLLERRGPVAGGAASQACAGGVRQQGRAPVEMPLALFSIRLWRALAEELEADIGYLQQGMTVVTDDEALVPALAERVRREQALGLDIELVPGPALHALVPGIGQRMLAGSHCPTDGQANPHLTLKAFYAAARRLGARILWNCPAQGFTISGGRLAAVLTPRGPIACTHAILAAGFWSRELTAGLGLSLPLQAHALQMMVTGRRPPALAQVLGWMGHGVSLKQTASGGFLIGGGWPAECTPPAYATRLLPGSMTKSALTAMALYPGLSQLPVVRAWAGIEAFCKDELQLVGPVDVVPGLILATGFSGHGFGVGPGVGALLARFVTTGRMPAELTPFDPMRFAISASASERDSHAH